MERHSTGFAWRLKPSCAHPTSGAEPWTSATGPSPNASRHLHLETLETRNSDGLDFHEVAVWSIRAALEAAFEAGRQGRASVPPQRRGKGGKVIALAIKSNSKSTT